MNDSFANLEDTQSRYLFDIETRYWEEARSCQRAGAYLAGCVMLGAALEASLMAMVTFHASEVAKCNAVPMRKTTPKKLLEWTLKELLDVAHEMGWLSMSAAVDADPLRWSIGDHAQAVRLLRNLVHPGQCLKGFPGFEVKEDELRATFNVLNGVYVHLHAVLSVKINSGAIQGKS